MLRTVLQTSGASLRALGSTRFPATCRALAAASSSSPPPDESNKSDSSAQRRRVSADYSAVDNESSSGGHSIVIDRSGLFQFAEPTQSTGDDAASTAAARAVEKEAETEMAKHVKAMIQFRGGPLTVAEYMKEVLTNPIAGFYMGEQVIGSSGDFITSPEISQMFGEMVGIWTVCMWQQMGCPERLRIVELGPGKGTLMADLLRGTKPFAPFQSALDIRLVEVGTGLRKAQWRTLQCGEEGSEMEEGVEASVSRIGGAPIQWHRTLQDIPSDTPTVYIAHEFLDALPVHQFQRSEGGKWVERLIDMASPDSPLHLRFVLSPRDTPARQLILDRRLKFLGADATKYDEMEVGAVTMSVASEIAQRIRHEGGAALLIDYGQDAPYPTSVQGIKNHKMVGVLESPGEVDLSAWVDFSSVRQAVVEEAGGEAVVHGPITQAHFLRSLGIDARLEALLPNASPKQAGRLKQGFARLVGSSGEGGLQDGMGSTYKAMVIAHKDLPTPVAFEPQTLEALKQADEQDDSPTSSR